MQTVINGLKAWFLLNKRDLPWRIHADPYKIWISEIMLQQTQVTVVIPYFLRWIERFPTILALAEASLDEVLKLWEGLGYYSRARYLHQGAKDVVEKYGGVLPSDEDSLKKIKGVGPYTIGAILSFAFHQKKRAVDANVIRVLTRYFQIEENVSQTATLEKVNRCADLFLEDEEPWLINEALIELGALICQKIPQCQKCPLNQNCLSLKNGKEGQLPIKAFRKKTVSLYRLVPVIKAEKDLLIHKGKQGKIMADLYQFPFFETDKEEMTLAHLQCLVRERFGLEAIFRCALPQVKHAFTHYKVALFPFLFEVLEKKQVSDLEWVEKQVLQKKAFSAGHRRIFAFLKNE